MGPQGPEGPTGPAGPGAESREVYRDADVPLDPTGGGLTVATMANVAPGSYLVSAKTTMVQTTPNGEGGNGAFARCTLNGDSTTNTANDDYAETEIGRDQTDVKDNEVGRATLATQVTTTLTATGSFTFNCRRTDNSGAKETVVVRETKIIAIKVGTTTRTPVGG